DDGMFRKPGEFPALELDAAAGRFGLAAYHVEQGGLAGAIGADDHPQLVLVHVHVQVLHRLEAVEGDRQILDGEDEIRFAAHCSLLSATAALTMPAVPPPSAGTGARPGFGRAGGGPLREAPEPP